MTRPGVRMAHTPAETRALLDADKWGSLALNGQTFALVCPMCSALVPHRWTYPVSGETARDAHVEWHVEVRRLIDHGGAQ